MFSRRSRKRFTAAVAATLAVVTMAGCSKTSTAGGGSSTSSGSGGAVDTSNYVLVASVINTTNPYMASMIQGAQSLGKKLNIPVQIVDSQGSSQTEISKIQAILAQGKKAIVMVNTVASSDAPTIVNAVKQAGGFVTIWWNKPDSLEPWDVGNNFVAFQKYSGVESGECTAKALAEGIGKKGNVVGLAGVLDSTTSQTRVAGFKEGLKAYPDVHLLDVQPANWDPQLGLTVTQNLLTKYPNQINGIWAADDGMIIGATEATKKANSYDKIKYVSDGLYPDVITQMEQANTPVVGETFHRGFMAASIGLYTAYLAATGKIDPSTLPHEKRDSLFKLACTTPADFKQYTKWDNNVDGWVDTLLAAKDPWSVEPTPLVSGGPEKLPS